MRNVAAVLRRELAGLFGHPVAYVALGLFVGWVAFTTLWFEDVLVGGAASMRRPFWWISLAFVFFVPAVTMRLLAEERRTGALQLLTTLPITASELVFGKWLAAVALVAAALALTLPWPVALAWLGPLDWGPVVGGYLGLLGLGGAFAAIGLAASGVSESQVVAFLLAASACAVPWLVGQALPLVPGPWVPLVQYLTFDYHLGNLARGVIDTRSLVFAAGVAAVGLRFAVLGLDHRRLS